jgi:acetate kinase
LERLGIVLDAEKNRSPHEGPLQINTPESSVALFVIPTNEELEIAQQTRELLEAKGLS